MSHYVIQHNIEVGSPFEPNTINLIKENNNPLLSSYISQIMGC